MPWTIPSLKPAIPCENSSVPLAAKRLRARAVEGQREEHDVPAVVEELVQREEPGVEPRRRRAEAVDDEQRRPRPIDMTPVLGVGDAVASLARVGLAHARVERAVRAREAEDLDTP